MEFKGSTQTDIKRDNQKMIFSLLFENGPMTRAEIAKALESSKPTVSKNVAELLQTKRIIEVGKEDNAVGKKGILIDVNANYQYVLGIDLSKDSFHLVLANLRGEWLLHDKISVEDVYEPKQAEQYLETYFKQAKEQNIDISKVSQVVISYPGVVGQNDGYYLTNVRHKEVLLHEVKNFLKAKNFDPIFVKNDINLAAVAEKRYGIFQDEPNLYLLSAHTGVGVGIIISHRLYEGERNAAGEIGFILPKKQEDGRYYTLEERVGLQAIRDRYQELTGQKASFGDIQWILSHHTDSKVMDLYDEILEEFSVAITNIALVLDIQKVILTGHVFDLKDTMIQDLQERVNQMTPIETNIYRSMIENASVKGAILIGIERIIEA
jgi:predicted NBD/HSP70 family sugar kinase